MRKDNVNALSVEESFEGPKRGIKQPTGAKFRKAAVEVLVIVLCALLISSLTRHFLVQMFEIPSGSMQNTITIGDRILVNKLGSYKRGDIVVFSDPGNWLSDKPAKSGPVRKVFEFLGLAPSSDQEYLIKRIIGMPGDRVKCCNAIGQIEINGKILDERGYIYAAGGIQDAPSLVSFDVVVPEGHIWVMGDHRRVSKDSRFHMKDQGPNQYEGSNAFVPTKNIVGPAWVLVAPFDRWRVFHTPKVFKDIPSPKEPAPKKAFIYKTAQAIVK